MMPLHHYQPHVALLPVPGNTNWMRSMLTSADQQPGFAEWSKGHLQPALKLIFSRVFMCGAQSQHRHVWDCRLYNTAAASLLKSVTSQDHGLLLLLRKQAGEHKCASFAPNQKWEESISLWIICCPISTPRIPSLADDWYTARITASDASLFCQHSTHLLDTFVVVSIDYRLNIFSFQFRSFQDFLNCTISQPWIFKLSYLCPQKSSSSATPLMFSKLLQFIKHTDGTE